MFVGCIATGRPQDHLAICVGCAYPSLCSLLARPKSLIEEALPNDLGRPHNQRAQEAVLALETQVSR